MVGGRVQGVGFRYSALHRAQELALTGWVRNGLDGRSVELEIQGSPASVERMTDWLRSGPRWAIVDRLHQEEIPPVGETGFQILPDG